MCFAIDEGSDALWKLLRSSLSRIDTTLPVNRARHILNNKWFGELLCGQNNLTKLPLHPRFHNGHKACNILYGAARHFKQGKDKPPSIMEPSNYSMVLEEEFIWRGNVQRNRSIGQLCQLVVVAGVGKHSPDQQDSQQQSWLPWVGIQQPTRGQCGSFFGEIDR